MQNKTKQENYFFVDESGDPTFFNHNGRCIIGEKGASPLLIIGFASTHDPSSIRKFFSALHATIAQDEYLKAIPSIKKTLRSFHAKDDCPEVREKVFKLIKTLDFKAQFVVARKNIDVFIKRHQRNENIFYTEIVTRLFERSLHKSHNIIYFSKRGSQVKQRHLVQAIQSAILNFEWKYGVKVETQSKILIQIPTDEPCLQLIDYLNWMVYRAYTKREMRYFNFLKEKISLIIDIYDFDKYPKNFYNRNNPFDIIKL